MFGFFFAEVNQFFCGQNSADFFFTLKFLAENIRNFH